MGKSYFTVRLIIYAWKFFTFMVRFNYRWFLGRALIGERPTNATFFHAGTKQYREAERLTFWAFLPEWQRAAIRTVGTVYFWFSLIVWFLHPAIVVGVDGVSIVGLLAYAGYSAHDRYQRSIADRVVLRPLWATLGRYGFPLSENPRDWIDLPTRYSSTDCAVTVKLPADWQSDAPSNKLLYELVTRKIGGEWDAKWKNIGDPVLTLTKSPSAPGMVRFAETIGDLQRLKKGQLLLGYGTRGNPEIINMDAETPHIAMNIGTGGGKSSTLCTLIVQLLHQGARIEACDPKRVSLNALRGLDGITIHRDVASQWDAIKLIRAEMDLRYERLDADESLAFDRLVLVIEEANTFHIDSQDYWDEVKPKGAGKTPGIYKDLNAILNKGRQCNVNVITVFQRMSADVAGGSAARDQYGYKILGRFSPQAWKCLVDTYPRPKSSRHPGRVITHDGDAEKSVQTVYAMDGTKLCAEALEWATPAVAALTVPASWSTPTDEANDLLPQAAQVATTCEAPPVGLRTAVDNGALTVSLDAAKWARANDPEFPTPVATGARNESLYREVELARWNSNRVRVSG